MPFAREIPTDRLFPAPQRQELLARLQYAIRHRAFAVVTGEVGAGKSTTIRALYDQLDRTRHLFGTSPTPVSPPAPSTGTC